MEKGAMAAVPVGGDAAKQIAEREATLEQRILELETELVRVGSGREEAMRYKAERAGNPRHRPATEEKAAELEAQLVFCKAAYAEVLRYMDMEEEDVEEGYRRAGKLHMYDPDKEWQKRAARVARVYPPPKHVVAEVAEFMKYLEEEEEEEDDYFSGLFSL